VARFLESAGLDTLYSLPGSQVLPIWDGLSERMRLIVPRSERAGSFMAEGYARAGQRPAVVINTLGPGVANELVGFASARASQAPVVSICPFQPPRKRERIAEVFQGLDHPELFAPFSKWTKVVDTAGELGPALAAAFDAALSSPCGPVRVEISFPLLFERAGFSRDQLAKPLPAPGVQGLCCVSETVASPLPPGLAERVAAQRGRLLAPGIGEAGHAIPFALGAKLASSELPVVVVTRTCFLLQHLDSLVLARSHGVPVRLVGPAGVGLDRIASSFSLERIDDASAAPWERLTSGERGLFVACTG
jgi:thiamine pyrophosphate-dependent acetolactate synthase large subunit-like protein